MLIKFTSGGRGGGRTIAEYLTSPERPVHIPTHRQRWCVGIWTGRGT